MNAQTMTGDPAVAGVIIADLDRMGDYSKDQLRAARAWADGAGRDDGPGEIMRWQWMELSAVITAELHRRARRAVIILTIAGALVVGGIVLAVVLTATGQTPEELWIACMDHAAQTGAGDVCGPGPS